MSGRYDPERPHEDAALEYVTALVQGDSPTYESLQAIYRAGMRRASAMLFRLAQLRSTDYEIARGIDEAVAAVDCAVIELEGK